LIVFKSFFIPLSVALLAAASLQSGGERVREIGLALRAEADAAILSLADGVEATRTQATRLPPKCRNFWSDAQANLRMLEADAATTARIAARRVSAMIKTT